MKSKLVFFLLLLSAISGCQDSGPDPSVTLTPELDVRAVLADYGDDGLTQVLLRMELLHYGGDLLKFGLSEVADHQARLQYYLGPWRRDIFLLDGKDTLPCLDAHLERLNLDAPYRNFVLTFRADHPPAAPELLLYETQYTQQILQLKLSENGR